MLCTPRTFRIYLTALPLWNVVACGDNGIVISDPLTSSAGTTKEDAGRQRDDDRMRPEQGDNSSATLPEAFADGSAKCAGIRESAPIAKGSTDLIFLIDTSGSMLHAAGQVATNMASFVQNFESIYNTRVVVITGADPARGADVAKDADRYKFISSVVDSKVLFATALSLYPDYKDFLREEATTQFVMVTDDNDVLAPDDFRVRMEDLLGHPFVEHAIASESVNGLPCTSEAQMWDPLCVGPIPAICAAMAVGDTYYRLAETTGGSTQSICKEDWTSVFEKLRAAVIEAVPLPCSYPLASASQRDIDFDKVQVLYSLDDDDDEEFVRARGASACRDARAWYYDHEDAPTTIQLCPDACTAVNQGGTIDVAFGCNPATVL